MNIFFASDHHLGHKSILNFEGERRQGTTIEEHNEWIVDSHNAVVSKGDIIYFLGDVAFGHENLKYLDRMKGQKFLVRGNHDGGDLKVLAQYFQNVYGLLKYKGLWLSHAPVHPNSLRKTVNVHGHLHSKVVQHELFGEDPRYINVGIENIQASPVTLDHIRTIIRDRKEQLEYFFGEKK